MKFFNKTSQNKIILILFSIIVLRYKKCELFIFMFKTHMSVAIQHDLLQVLEVSIVDESPQIGAVGRRN